ncbi:MAG: VOC family protein [Gracilibacteraceae bacterium]|jgi:lactoylglutathione lyase|nr:VOC family protein [Gracilibacteraceae bacterium]
MNKVAHIGLIVKDVDRSVEFYTKLCGCALLPEKAYENNLIRIQFLSLGDVVIEILQHKAPDPVGNRWRGVVDHVAIETDDMEDVLTKMKEAGVKLLEGPRRSIIGASIAFFEAPDGERVEFIYPDCSD